MRRIVGMILLAGWLVWGIGTCWAGGKIGVGAGESYGGLGLKAAYVFRLGHSAESSTGEAYFGLGTAVIPGIALRPVVGIKGHFVGSHGAYASCSVASSAPGHSLGYVLEHNRLMVSMMGGYDFPLNRRHSIFFSPAVGIYVNRISNVDGHGIAPAHYLLNLGFDFKL